ncbi:Choline/ethanolamine kinase [uncultured delta proteobacterium]|uniref:Choline/ethanolamine kinase n=1 Tax=uncultured delta proteobacterium TaxID=34034 RepID=A0A212JCH1_9DELT|nr:Choline/ethanolamine kinase [uncultured delta proteobacterium]
MNAILFCAGVGRRFQPISFTCPKPLTPINGVPIVEQTLQMLRESGIERITLIVGYMAEKFAYLGDKYGVEFVFNPDHATRNTHSSLLLATDRLDGSLLIDGDVVFTKNVLSRVQPGKSQYVCQPTVHGLEWEVFPDETGRITRVEKWTATGHSMCGLSYWEGETAAALAKELHNCAPDDYWEEAVLRILDRVPVYATLIEEPFLQETDTISDALHYGLITHEEVARLSSVDFPAERLKGLTNSTWLVRDHTGVMRCLRIPGHGTGAFIDREQEPVIIGLIKDLNVTPESLFFPGGLKMTRFMSEHRVAVAEDLEPGFFASLAAKLKVLNSIPHTPESPLAPMLIADQITKFETLTKKTAPPAQRAWLLAKAREYDAEPQVLCHRDLALENILVSGDHGKDLLLIDFEYAGFAHPIWEIASFILESGMDPEAREQFATACGITEEREKTRLWEMESLVDYVWGLWGFERGYLEYSEKKLNRMLGRLETIL